MAVNAIMTARRLTETVRHVTSIDLPRLTAWCSWSRGLRHAWRQLGLERLAGLRVSATRVTQVGARPPVGGNGQAGEECWRRSEVMAGRESHLPSTGSDAQPPGRQAGNPDRRHSDAPSKAGIHDHFVTPPLRPARDVIWREAGLTVCPGRFA